MEPHIFERGESVYLIAPVTPVTPRVDEIEHFAFAKQLQDAAPNENLVWLQGAYVEADNPNRNGHMWTAGELGIKKLTPMFMPVTVMHDPRTAVGLIADVALKTPDSDQVPRSRIETALALWGHRFPEVIEEADLNYKAGTLMQSMECRSATYSCAECGKTFAKLPDGAERANWCEHMKASDGNGARILGDVTFTGTGLIFGTRGSRGAYDEAHLDVLQDEVAEFHEKAQRGTPRPRRKRTSMDPIEISREEYAELQKRPSAEDLAAEKKRADDAETAKAEAEKKAEGFETEAKKEKDRADDLEKKVTEAEESKAKDELAKERLAKLGSGFKEKLGDFTRERFEQQARDLSEEEWENRVKELEETAGVKRDEGGTGPAKDPASKKGGEFSREETAASHAGGSSNGGSGEEPSPEGRRSVMSGLMGKKQTSTTASE